MAMASKFWVGSKGGLGICVIDPVLRSMMKPQMPGCAASYKYVPEGSIAALGGLLMLVPVVVVTFAGVNVPSVLIFAGTGAPPGTGTPYRNRAAFSWPAPPTPAA